MPELAALAPVGERRMSANPHANGGLLLRDLELPDFRDYAVDVPSAGVATFSEADPGARHLAARRHPRATRDSFRLFGPDETAPTGSARSSRPPTGRGRPRSVPADDHLAPDGRVMEVLSEHLCQGWLEGYLLTGRHGLFTCYEAFIHIVDSMFNQHAKWLKTTRQSRGAGPIASLNYLLTSHVWRQDHNGFSHQDPGFIDHVVNKKAEVVRVYLPPDANTLLSVADHCLRSRNYVNVDRGRQAAVAGLPDHGRGRRALHPRARHLGLGQHRRRAAHPDVVLACAGDVPTLETLAAADLLREHLPDLEVRVVNVVDLMRLQPDTEHPHGLSDREFDALFTTDRPVIFAYPRLPVADPPAHLPAHRTTPTSTCAATRRRAPRPRRSTWSCSTTWTATTWSWTSSTGCPASAPTRPRCGSRWRTCASPPAPTPASTARTIPAITDWTWPH